MGHPLAGEVGKRVDTGLDMGIDLQGIAELAVIGPHQCEGHRAGQIDREGGRPGGEAGDMQATAAHGFDLRRVGLNGEEAHVTLRDLREVVDERLPDIGVDGRVFHRGIGEDEGVGVGPLRLVGGQVGDHVALLVAVETVQVTAGAVGLSLGGDEPGQRQQRGEGQGGEGGLPGSQACFHGVPHDVIVVDIAVGGAFEAGNGGLGSV